VKIILGSSSPRRKEILSKIIDTFDICIPHVDEKIVEGENPLDYSNRIAREKIEYLRKVVSPSDESCLMISCDTVVTIDNTVIGKPRNYADAMGKIGMLSGKTHRVISSISLALGREDAQKTSSEITEVTFKNLGKNDIIEYLNSINYRDKAGAYALQENGELIIEKIHGSVTNVIGFPLRLFFRLLFSLNIVDAVFLPMTESHPGT
jgi:septum formation protein